MKREKDIFPKYPARCDFCTRIYMSQDEYIRHLEFHVRDMCKKLNLVL